LFAEGVYEYTNYEYAFPGGTERDSYDAVLAGGGMMFGGGKVGSYVSALYDFSYDDDDPFRPYDSPWRYQVGVTFGF
jgi:hypothetical protein